MRDTGIKIKNEIDYLNIPPLHQSIDFDKVINATQYFPECTDGPAIIRIWQDVPEVFERELKRGNANNCYHVDIQI